MSIMLFGALSSFIISRLHTSAAIDYFGAGDLEGLSISDIVWYSICFLCFAYLFIGVFITNCGKSNVLGENYKVPLGHFNDFSSNM